nr:MAG TPA: hypothetical protein [Caudoviricetes sp.]
MSSPITWNVHTSGLVTYFNNNNARFTILPRFLSSLLILPHPISQDEGIC